MISTWVRWSSEISVTGWWRKNLMPHTKILAFLLCILVLMLAIVVSSLIGLLRPSQNIQIEEKQLATIPIVLTTIGIGAPVNLAELHDLNSTHSSHRFGAHSSVGVTAQRYSRHLVNDLVIAPSVSVPMVMTTDEIQAIVSSALQPGLMATELPSEPDAVATSSRLFARIGLDFDKPLPPYFMYEVQRGDTVNKIAKYFGIQADSIFFNNFEVGTGESLQVGGQLSIPTKDGVIYTVRPGDTLSAVAENFDADIDDILAFEGNDLTSADHLVVGSTLLLVGGSASVGFGIAGPVYAIPEFRWPMGGMLTDFFGSPRANRYGYHTGIDLGAPTGTFIGAAAAGLVVQTGWEGSFGKTVVIDHGGGVMTRYAHLDHIDVFLGAWVEAGTLLGFLGNTGYSTGPHLHFEIIMGGVPQDPLVWLNQ